MSNLKKAISMILVFAMLATSAVFTTAVFAEEATVPAVSNVVLNDADLVVAEKLAVFGIIDPIEDTQALKNYLTRGEMVDALIRYMNMSNITNEAETTPFLDVDIFDKRVGAYTALYRLGYIQGDENKNFRPNDLLTYNEAITLVISAMGYKMFATRNGGYPGGYLYIANKCELLKDLRGNGNNPIPYCDLYRLFDASLLTNAVVERSFATDGNASFAISENMTVLEELHNIKVIKGVVTGNENTRLLSSNSDGIGRYQIRIENEIYDTPENEYAEYLGRRVIGYAKTNEWNDDQLLFVELDKNDEYTIQAEDLVPAKTTQGRIYYETEPGKEKFISVDTINLAVIYNGKSRSGYGALSGILPQNGYIVGVDNTLDGAVDVLFVYEYENYIVNSIDLSAYTISARHTNEVITLNPYRDDVRIYDVSGKSMDFEKIETGSLVSVMQSANTSGYKLITVYNEGKVLAGMIEETLDGEYKINGTFYRLAPNAEALILGGYLNPISVGLNATFYLDHAGKIAYYERTGTNAMYGFVLGAEKDDGLDKRVTIRIFTQEGVWVELDTATKVTIDGTPYSLRSLSDLNTVFTSIPSGEVILYKVRGNEIIEIDTYVGNAGGGATGYDVGNLNKLFEGDFFAVRDGVAHKYRREGITATTDVTDLALDKFVIPSDVVIFSVPKQEDWFSKPEDFSVSSTISNGSQARKHDEGYIVYNLDGTEEINKASCILLKGVRKAASTSTGISNNTAFSVVSKINSALDEEGLIRDKLYVNQDGAESGYLMAKDFEYFYSAPYNPSTNVATDISTLSLQPGDVVQLGFNDEDEVAQINIVYRKDPNNTEAWLQNPEFNMTFETSGGGGALGTVGAVDAKTGVIRLDVGESTYYTNAKSASISIYNQSTQKSEVASFSSIKVTDLILVRGRFSATASQILIIRP